MLFIDVLKKMYVFSEDLDRPGALTAWSIVDKFESCGEYLVLKNVETGIRKCCFTYYDLKFWDTPDPINYPLDKVMAGLAEIQDLNEVLVYDRDLVEDEEPYGWLSPEGRFYHCQCGDHVMIARVVLGSSEFMLENHGWCKVLHDDFLTNGCYLTCEQAHWLKQHGFDEEDVDLFSRG